MNHRNKLPLSFIIFIAALVALGGRPRKSSTLIFLSYIFLF
jgi:hypothetical protein